MDSILRQNVEKEIIVIDDGSTDQSALILQQYSLRYPEICVITQQNKGAGAARNIGIREAKGEFICFVDSDDYLIVEDFQLLIDLVQQHSCHIFRGIVKVPDCEEIKGKFLVPIIPRVYSEVLNNRVYGELVYTHDYLAYSIASGYMPRHCFGFYRVSFLRENNLYYPEIIAAEDEVFELNCLTASLDCVILELALPFYFCQHREEGLSTSNNGENQFIGSLLAYDKLVNILGEYRKLTLGSCEYLALYQKNYHNMDFVILRLLAQAYLFLYERLNAEQQKNVAYLVKNEHFFEIKRFIEMLRSNHYSCYPSAEIIEDKLYNLVTACCFKLFVP